MPNRVVAKRIEPSITPSPDRDSASGKTVLIAVSGASPAILTEAVWALAREASPVIPDLVVVVTSASGAQSLKSQLLTPVAAWQKMTVWQSLRQAILGPGHSHECRLTLEAPVIVTRADPASGTAIPLDDIRTAEDNAAAAETILAAVRRFSTDPDTRLVGLLSGGRKTMGALLHAAFSLAGRSGDRLLHVLVNEPFENPRLNPVFYFPGQPGRSEHRVPGSDVTAFANNTAQVELADVPLVALGELVVNRTAGQAPATFASFARAARATVTQVQLESCPIKINFSTQARKAVVNHYSVVLPEGRSAAFFRQVIVDAENGHDLVSRSDLETRWREKGVTYQGKYGRPQAFSEDDLSKAQNTVREKLRDDGKLPMQLVDRLFPLREAVGLRRAGVTTKLVD